MPLLIIFHLIPPIFVVMSYQEPNRELEASSDIPGGTPSASQSYSSLYKRMIVESYAMPVWKDIITATFHWILLAGFVIFPATFTSLSHLDVLTDSTAGRVVLYSIRNKGLLAIAIMSCAIGVAGIGWAWWEVRHNYVWLVTKIFM